MSMMGRDKRILMDGLRARVRELDGDNHRLRSGLQWVANQHCERNPGGEHVCAESGDCLTEWCLPCFAEATLRENKSTEASRLQEGAAAMVVNLAMERDAALRRESAAADLVAQLSLERDEAREQADGRTAMLDVAGIVIDGLRATLREALKHEPGQQRSQRSVWRCPDCGLGVSVDEDGCCATCGMDCMRSHAIVTVLPTERYDELCKHADTTGG